MNPSSRPWFFSKKYFSDHPDPCNRLSIFNTDNNGRCRDIIILRQCFIGSEDEQITEANFRLITDAVNSLQYKKRWDRT